MCEAIELPFGVVSGIGLGNGVLDGDPPWARGTGYHWISQCICSGETNLIRIIKVDKTSVQTIYRWIRVTKILTGFKNVVSKRAIRKKNC